LVQTLFVGAAESAGVDVVATCASEFVAGGWLVEPAGAGAA